MSAQNLAPDRKAFVLNYLHTFYAKRIFETYIHFTDVIYIYIYIFNKRKKKCLFYTFASSLE